MGITSKKSKTTSKETLAPSTYSQPYIDSAAATFKPAYDQSQALVDRYLPQAQKGVDYFGDVLGGKYLDQENPYMQGMIDRTNENVSNRVNSNFSASGRYGSDYHTGELTRGLADSENSIRYGNYATERGYQQQAPLQQQALIESTVGLPGQASGQYASNIAALLGKYVTSTGQSTTKSSPSLISMLASAAQAAAPFASDIRLKTNIERVGETPDGMGIFEWDYLPIEGRIAEFMPEGRQRGVMAHEVAVLRPDALGPAIDGYQTVNYSALGAM